MKNIVIADEFKSKDFKPSVLLAEYISLIASQASHFFPKEGLKSSVCPGCGTCAPEEGFEKLTLMYRRCHECRTVYVSPRPADKDIARFYKESRARSFWNEQLYRSTAGPRQEKIIKPRFQWIEDSVQEYFPKAKRFADLNANQHGYIAQIIQLGIFEQKTFINPLVEVEGGRGVNIIDRPWWEVDGQWDVLTLFEVLDHTSDVEGILRKINAFLPVGGLCFLTDILGSGFDLQVLGPKASHLNPPDRLNAFSVEGLKTLFRRHGFECLEFSTPGILDLELVAAACQVDASLTLPAFIDYMISRGDEGLNKSFQEFLQSNLLSSYGRILIRKV